MTIDTKRLRDDAAMLKESFSTGHVDWEGVFRISDALPALLDLAERYETAPEVVVGETGMVFAGPKSYGQRIRLVPTTGEGE